MKATSTCSLFFGICLLVGRFAAAAVPMNLEMWDAHPFHWKARAEGLYGKDPNGFAILADVPTAGKQTFTARLTVEDDSGDGWGVAGIALIDDERNFWHLALVRSPKDEPRPPSFELAEMYQGKWLSQQTLELDHLESEGGWKVGETLLFTLVNEGSGILGEIKNYIADLRLSHSNLMVFMTGGDGRLLHNRLSDKEIIYNEHLAAEGLNRILLYQQSNENH